MPSDFCFDMSPDHLSLSLSSSRRARCIVIDDHCCHSADSLAERIQDHAKLLVPKTSSTSIFIDQLPFDDDDHGYKAIILSRDKSGKRKVLLEGEYKFSDSKSEAKRKALEALLEKSGAKVKEAIEKPKMVTPAGRWVFLQE